MKNLNNYICMVMILSLFQIGDTHESETPHLSHSLDELLSTKISTASKYDQEISEIPASVTIITSEEINEFGYDNLADVLNRVAGFYISYDRNYYYLGTRGFGRPTDYNNRVKLLLDGQTMNENFYGSTSIGTDFVLDIDAIERIEVVKGPGSVLYGTGAMFAVINIITKDSKSFEGLNISSELGSYGRKSTSILYNKEFSFKSRLSLSGMFFDEKGQDIFFPEYNQLSTNYGIAEGKDWSEYKGIHAKYDNNNFSLAGYYGRGNKGIPTGVYDTDFNTNETYTIDEYSYVNASYKWTATPLLSVDFKTSYNHYYYYGSYPFAGFLTYDANWGDWYGADIQLNWNLNTKNRITAGSEIQHNSKALYKYWDEDDEIYFNKDFPYSVYSVYMQNEYQALQNLSLTTGIRYDNYTKSENYFTPRAAIVYHPGKLTTLKFLYGKAFRSPSLYELYYEDSYYGSLSNPELVPEEITTAEFVIEQQLNNNHFSRISLYNYEMKNLIDNYEDEILSTYQYQNLGKINSYGFELDIQGRYQNGLNWFVNYTYENTKEAETDAKLTNSPSDLFKAGIASKVGRHFLLSIDSYYENKRLTVYDTETDAYFLLNAHIKLSPRLKNQSEFSQFLNNTSLSVKVKNLFDKEYANPGGYEHLQDQITQNGRTVVAKFSIQL